MQRQIEGTLKEKFPEIDRVFARTGTCRNCLGPHARRTSRTGYIMAQAHWTNGPSHARLVTNCFTAIQEVSARFPGNNYEFSQPIQLRFNELISGVRSDVAVKTSGRHGRPEQVGRRDLFDAAEDPRASEVKVEQTTGLPMLTVNIDRQKALAMA
ncbi:AcrB/AcrD/AcrF family protein [Acidovorax sp. 100]|uniref:efflux RND transporter permease subunit n=1 Tax=Acidovorax sp. 100 TaxID=2135635 RepID=UPI000F0FC3AD|nr:efflux RND transporter permease subunit [Acidovorax sp. 100]RMA56528.1 AcrB/AcrD/AcrF family protein [Acidovorax sp. 100]